MSTFTTSSSYNRHIQESEGITNQKDPSVFTYNIINVFLLVFDRLEATNKIKRVYNFLFALKLEIGEKANLQLIFERFVQIVENCLE